MVIVVAVVLSCIIVFNVLLLGSNFESKRILLLKIDQMLMVSVEVMCVFVCVRACVYVCVMNSGSGRFSFQEYFSQFQDTTDALPCHIHLPLCLWIMDTHSRAPKKNTSHGHEVLPQDTTHLIQRPCYQRGSLCQDPAGSRTTRRPPDHRKETQTAVVWSCLSLIRSGQNHLTKAQWGGGERERERKQGRERKRCEDNIREWTGMGFAKSQRAVENGEKWRTTLAVKG